MHARDEDTAVVGMVVGGRDAVWNAIITGQAEGIPSKTYRNKNDSESDGAAIKEAIPAEAAQEHARGPVRRGSWAITAPSA